VNEPNHGIQPAADETDSAATEEAWAENPVLAAQREADAAAEAESEAIWQESRIGLSAAPHAEPQAELIDDGAAELTPSDPAGMDQVRAEEVIRGWMPPPGMSYATPSIVGKFFATHPEWQLEDEPEAEP
jgi:hypothetical protein